MRGVVFATEYSVENGKTVVYLVGRDEQGKRIKVRDESIQPRFYVPADAKNLNYIDIAKVEDYPLLTDHKERVKQITTKTPGDVKKLRIRYKTFHEGDIPFEDVYTIQKELTGGFEIVGGKICPNDSIQVAPKILYLDIEVATKAEFPNPAFTRYPIIVIGCYDSYENKHHIFHSLDKDFFHLPEAILHKKGSEVAMLYDFIRWFRAVDPDYIAGWNVGRFDMAYLINRCFTCYNLPTYRLSLLNRAFVRMDGKGVVRGKRIFEMRNAYFEKIKKELPSYTLGYVAKRELGEDTEEITDFEEVWRNTPEKILERNFKHVNWLVRIDKKRELSHFFERLRRFAGCNIEKVFGHGKIADMVLLRACKNKFVKSGMTGKKKESYKAAIVFEPVRGLHFDVIVLDFKSTYPSIMLDHNIPSGLIHEVLENLLDWRNRVKSEMTKEIDPAIRKTLDLDQFSLKTITNTFYGVLGAGSSRWFSINDAKDITSKGREYLTELRAEAERREYENLSGDTDSNFVKAKTKEVRAEGEKLASELTESLRKYVREKYKINSRISVELDRIYSALLLKDKKFYAGYLLGEEKELEIKGMIKKGSMSVFVCNALEELVKIILDGKAKELGEAYFKELWSAFSKAPPAEICPPAILRKPPIKYDRTSNVVRGVAYSNLYLGTSYDKGDRFKIGWIKAYPHGKPFTDVIAFSGKLPEGYRLDRRKIFKGLKDNIKEILDLVVMKKQTKIEGWLK